jgi:RNA polymerase sigma factor (sigma-70 family)
VLDAERRDMLFAAVNELPDDQRVVVSLRYFVGLSEDEVAETLGIPQGPSSRVRRGRSIG